MALDKLLKDTASWLEQAAKQPIFGRLDANALAFPEEQRQRRIADLKARINELNLRKSEASASYDRAIALEQSELDRLAAERPLRPQQARKQAVKAAKKKKS